MGFSLNSVAVSGNLTRDPESPTQGVTRLSIAHNERRKQGEEWVDVAHFFEVTVFGKLGEAVARELAKGDPVAVSGTLEQRRWEQDGVKRSAVSIIARDVFRGHRAGSPGQQPQGGYQQQPAAVGGGWGDAPQDQGGIPF